VSMVDSSALEDAEALQCWFDAADDLEGPGVNDVHGPCPKAKQKT
jgi:hypothetical protein